MSYVHDNTSICPKCSKPGQCVHHGDVSASDRYVDLYTFECPHCGYQDKTYVDGGESGWNDHFTECPYCGR